jgi:lantibiotic biosynthesis protein
MVEKKLQQVTCLYTPADFYLMRAPVLPAETFFQLTALLAIDKTDLQEIEAFHTAAIARCYQELQSLISQSGIELAVATASLSLFEELQRFHRGGFSRKTERAFSRLLRYIVRMCTRPTPFGLFSGVAMGTFADQTNARLDTPVIDRIRTRPDMNWLFMIIYQIEQELEIVAQLHVTTNQTIHFAGGRVLLPNADIYGQSDSRALSLRATPPVRYALERARQAIRYADLHRELIMAFPTATSAQVDRLLWQLWENHFFLSNLRPPFAHEAPAQYVLDRLSTLQGVESTTTILQSVLEEAEALDRAGAGGSVTLLRNLARHQEQLVADNGKQQLPLQIDAALHLSSSSLNKEVGAAAAQAAETMLRLGRLSHGLSHLQQYLAAFQERYGIGQEVPLLDLLSPENGLDAPAAYQNPTRTYPLLPLNPEIEVKKLDAALCALFTKAISDRSIEVELTDEWIQQFEQWSPTLEEAPLSLDIYLQVHAASREALDRGEWKAAIGPNWGAMAGGRTFGRFFDLLGKAGVEKLQQFIRREEALAPEKIFAELSYLPQRARAANVVVRPCLRSYEIVIGTTPSVPLENVLQLDDLVVGVHNKRFYVRSLRLGKEVIVCQGHMLNPLIAPNVCRFLLEVGQSSILTLLPFDWGLVSQQPFLPRIVYGRVVLRPAQWKLSAATIKTVADGSETVRWFTELQHWRAEWRVPRYVYLTYADNRLLLDLEHPLMVRELQTELAKMTSGNTITLEELFPDFEHLWLEDNTGAKYFSEIVVPLIRADTLSVTPTQSTTFRAISQQTHVISQIERSAFPGDAWVYLKLYAAYKRHDELITGPLREVIRKIAQRELIDQWFYMRYCDSSPHLRIRFHTHPSHTSLEVLAETLAWSRQLVEQKQISRFCVDTYEREVERYGGPGAIEIMEHIFTADSVATSELVAALYHKDITLDPLAIAVFSLDTFFASWGLNFNERLQWRQRNSQKYEAGKEFHKKRQLFCDLLAPWKYTNDQSLLRQRALLCQLILSRQSPLKTASTHIHEIEKAGELWMPVENILGSLAHMHINRLFGINPQREQYIYSLWRQTLESLRLRPENKS